MKYFLVVNPRAQKRFPKDFDRLLAQAQSSGHELKFAVAESPADFEDLTKKAIAQGYDFILPFGGDGSLHLALQAFAESPETRSSLIPLPFGTGNDFYRGWIGNTDRRDLAWVFANPSRKKISMGKVAWGKRSRYFLNSLSLGITTSILEDYERSRVRHYLISTLRMITRYQAITLSHGDGTAKESLLLMICKGPYAGGGMRFHPKAGHESVQVLFIPKLSLAKVLRHLPKIYGEGLSAIPEVESFPLTQLSLEISSAKPQIEVDGEILVVSSKIEISLIPGALSLGLPP